MTMATLDFAAEVRRLLVADAVRLVGWDCFTNPGSGVYSCVNGYAAKLRIDYHSGLGCSLCFMGTALCS